MTGMDREEQPIEWKDFAGPMVAALAARALLLAVTLHATGWAAITAGDTLSYLLPGVEMIRHGCFCSGGLAEIDRTPGYPLFAMLTGGLWGNLMLTVMAQMVLGALCVLLAGKIAFAVFRNARAARATAWLMALEPLSLEYSIRVLSEALFVFGLLLFLWQLLRCVEDLDWRSVALAAAILAAMAYVRPIAYWLALPVALIFLLACARLGSAEKNAVWSVELHGVRWSRAAGRGALFLAIFAALVAPWQMRNRQVANDAGFSSIANKNLYFYEAGAVLAQQSHESLEAWQAGVGKEDAVLWTHLHPDQGFWTVAQRNAWLRSVGLQVLREHPWLFLQTYFEGEIRLLFSPGATEFFRLIGLRSSGTGGQMRRQWTLPQWMMAGCMEVFLLLLYFFAGRALLAQCLRKERREGRKALWVLAAIALYFLAVSGGGQAISRLRLPVMPILCVLAGSGLAGEDAWRDGDPGRI